MIIRGLTLFKIFPVICATHSGLIIEKNWYHSALSVGNYGISYLLRSFCLFFNTQILVLGFECGVDTSLSTRVNFSALSCFADIRFLKLCWPSLNFSENINVLDK